ncbi:MAG: T9SS type A sorting domain-containing protein [bacterium]|nr:T9SS type A sorting domain-containing protein [bacterium]
MVTVIAPNGGETIKGNFTIKWKYSDNNPCDLHTSDILLSLDGGATYSTKVASNLSDNITTFVWDTSKYESNKAKIKVVVTDNGIPSLQGEDESDGVFTLNINHNNLPPYIEILKPPAGETKASGNYLICWDDLDPDDNATITLYWDKDQSWYNNLEDKKDITWGIITSGIEEDCAKDSYLLDLSLIPCWCPWQRYFYVWGKIDDKINPPTYSCSKGRIIIYTKADVGGTTMGINKAMIEIGAGALSEDAFVFVICNPEYPSIDIANYKVTQNPSVYLPKSLEKSICEFKAVGMFGDLLKTCNTNGIKFDLVKGKTYITIPYDVEVKNQLKSSEDNLKIYYLNMEEKNWEKISFEQVLDKIKRTIKVRINKFGIYGILEEIPEGSYACSNISPYPNPLDLSKAGNYNINFGLLNNFKEIKIYNMAGELIETINTNYWNIVNKSYGSGIYYYLIFYNNGKIDKGKIAIIN